MDILNPLLIIIIIIAGVAGGVEYLIFRQRNKYGQAFLYTKHLNGRLEVLKAMSFLPASKKQTLKEDMDSLAGTFFQTGDLQTPLNDPDSPSHNKYTGLRVAILSNNQILRYDNTGNNTVLEGGETKELTTTEKNLIASLEKENSRFLILNGLEGEKGDSNGISGAFIIPLNYFLAKPGYLIIFTSNKLNIDEEEKNFFITISNIVSLLIKKFEFSQKLTIPEQLNAINIEW